jgi:1-phosphofructokinase family hexose kinase
VGGPVQNEIEAELGDLDVPYRLVQTRAATRVCTTILDRATGSVTELVENGRPLDEEELDAFRRAYAEEAAGAEVAILIGSLPAGTPVALYRELVERSPCRLVLDFRGEGLISVLDLEPLVVKPNREELAQTVGRPLDRDEELVAAMQSLNRRGARWVVVSQGCKPVWVTSAWEVYRLDPPPVDRVVNPIGSGDAMAAGIAWATRQGRPMVDAVRLGIGAAVENLREILPCRLDPAEVERKSQEVRIERM